MESTSADRTAVARVARYRERQRNERDIVRQEVRVPGWGRALLKDLGGNLSARGAVLEADHRYIDFALGTINAPRPRRMSAQTLVQQVLSATPNPEWRAHVAALFEEVSMETLMRITMSGVLSFEDLYRCIRIWGVDRNGAIAEWVEEMADLSLAKATIDDDPNHWDSTRTG